MHRALLVGAGGMGRAWAKNLLAAQNLVELSGWVDIIPGRVDEAVLELGAPSVARYSNLEHAIIDVRPDFIVDVTVPEAHENVTLLALQHGINVLGEKPMSTSMDSALRMVQAAHDCGLIYMVSQSRRYDAGLVAFRDAVGKLGGVSLLTADFFIGAHFDGFRNDMADVLLTDMAIHTFDAARFLIDAHPTTVFCDSFRLPWSWYEGDESAVALFSFEEGQRFCYRGSWGSEGHSTQWESTWRAVCPGGTVLWDGAQHLIVDKVVSDSGFVRETSKEIIPIEDAPYVGIAGSLRDFLNALSNRTRPMGICSDNIWSLAMVLFAIESSRSGQKVVISI